MLSGAHDVALATVVIKPPRHPRSGQAELESKMVVRRNNMRPAEVHELVTLNREQRYRGIRLVASVAHDAADCRELLDALGLDPADGRPPDDTPDHLPDAGWHHPSSIVERMAGGRTD